MTQTFQQRPLAFAEWLHRVQPSIYATGEYLLAEEATVQEEAIRALSVAVAGRVLVPVVATKMAYGIGHDDEYTASLRHFHPEQPYGKTPAEAEETLQALIDKWNVHPTTTDKPKGG